MMVARLAIAARRTMAVLLPFAVACAPRLAPLGGAPAPSRFPPTALAEGHHTVVFRWELDDAEFSARGDGAARLASPDSVRLDFFLAGGMGGGAVVLIGDTLRTPAPAMARKLIPPVPLLWASLGRAAVPPLADTVVRVDGAVLRADIGRPVEWRFTFHGDSLFRVEHVSGGRIVEWVERAGDGARYTNESSRRTLRIAISRTDESPPFDASIWDFQ
jgi:hypothetical protein